MCFRVTVTGDVHFPLYLPYLLKQACFTDATDEDAKSSPPAGCSGLWHV